MNIKNLKLISAVLVFSGFIFCLESVYAFWIWTPETKRWVNPKFSPQENARLQLELVQSLYEKQDYSKALTEARKLVEYFPKAREAAEGQFYAGMCYEKLNQPYQAFKAYELVVKKYPFSERVMEIVEREYEIGQLFLEEETEKGFLMILSGEPVEIEIFGRVIENAPYSPVAAAAQYKLGLALLKAKRLYEAQAAFQKVVEEYSSSEWVDEAKYQLAVTTASLSSSFEYDQVNRANARKRFEEFLKEKPEPALEEKAKEKITKLDQADAEGNFNIARFYEKQKAFESARIYYEHVINNYPQTRWAQMSKQCLENIGAK